jgi:hypothetical protein
MTYTNHSGGCEGADMAWETAGLSYGVKTIAYSFKGHKQYGANPYIMTNEELLEGWEACKIASVTLNRSLHSLRSTYVRSLICRNWYQVKHAETIFAIGMLVRGSDTLVDGGTGWAVQMAVDNKKPVYLFEQNLKCWMEYDEILELFVRIDYTPMLTDHFAGIGTRAITDDGLQAILEVYQETFI